MIYPEVWMKLDLRFLESTDFEDAIRNAISLGGDSDTLACITGGIAQAHYGVPAAIADRAMSILDKDLRDITARFMSGYCPATPPSFSTRPT
jgi:ADP-ribosylglycohydrolase